MTAKLVFKKIYDRLYVHLWEYRSYYTRRLCNQMKRSLGEKNIWLLGTPRSTNLGDHAQVLCSMRWFQKNYPDYTVHEYSSFELMGHDAMLLECIAQNVGKDDLIFFQSGYNFTDMYPFQEIMHREAVRRIPGHRVVFLPQTIKFEQPYGTNAFVQESRALYAGNEDIYLLCRDQKSLETAAEALPGVKKRAFPDFVTTMIGTTELPQTDRTNVMLCVRHDRESSLTAAEIGQLTRQLQTLGNVLVSDTTLTLTSPNIVRGNRARFIDQMLRDIRSCKVVVTDRYHGLVFSMVANTPVVLLKTIDHKITEGIKWFPAEMASHIRVAGSAEEAFALAEELAGEPEYRFDDFFQREYYDKLKDILDRDECWER